METSIPNQDVYFRALGHFAYAYSTLEITVQMSLWVHVRTDMNIARAIFNGVRIRDAIGRIKRIREVNAEPLDSDESKLLKRVFDQIGDITSARDDILHYGAWPSEDGADLTVTNWWRAHTEQSIKGFRISPEVLDAMASDVERCALILLNLNHWIAKKIKFGAEDLPEDWREPWRYKASEQAIHPSKANRDAPEHPDALKR